MRVQSRSRFTTRSAVWPALAMGLALCASETALAQYADGLGLSAQQEQKLNAMLTWNHARAAAQIASSKIVKQADVTAQQVKRVERYINERAEITTSLAMANIPGWKNKFEGPVGAQTIKASERDWTKWRSVASFVAPQLQLRNVHETGTSDVGAGSDGAKRALAEISTFWPSDGPHWQDVACSHKCDAAKMADPLIARFDSQANGNLLPKFGALNYYARFDGVWGFLFGSDNAPVTFAYKQSVKKRMTLMAEDSLQSWCGDKPTKNAETAGLITAQTPCPGQPNVQPWGSAPVGVYDAVTPKLSHVLNFRYGLVKDIASFLDDPTKAVASGLKAMANKFDGQQYVEAQIHGPVRIDRDIESVYINFHKMFGNPFFEPLYAALVRAKINMLWYFRKDTEAAKDHVLFQNNAAGVEPAKRVLAAWKSARAAFAAKLDALQKAGWTMTTVSLAPLSLVPTAAAAVTDGLWATLQQERKGKPALRKLDGLAWVRECIGPEPAEGPEPAVAAGPAGGGQAEAAKVLRQAEQLIVGGAAPAPEMSDEDKAADNLRRNKERGRKH